MVEFYPDGSRLGETESNRCDQMVFHPSANAEKGEVMPLLHLQSQFAKESQGGLGVVPSPELGAEIQETIHLIARDIIGPREQLINDVQGAPPMAVGRCAIDAALPSAAIWVGGDVQLFK
jgi:hypothetical protein